jgi:hypothetical protein
MDKYKNGHYSSYLDNIPRTWTGKNGHYSTYLDNILRTWTSIRMVTMYIVKISAIVTILNCPCPRYIVKIRAIVTILILVHVLSILSR